MRIIPVIDVMAGQVVRGVAGRRQDYRPLVSRLTSSCHPVDVAKAFLERFGFTELYLADLDAIAGSPPALPVYAALQALGIHLWVDAGVRDALTAQRVAETGVASIVVGLETLLGPEELRKICGNLGRLRTVFSLDLKEGQPLGDTSRWKGADPWSIAEQAVAAGIMRLIVLDLARVGVGSGTGTEQLCQQLASAYPQVEIVAGGGVRDPADLHRLKQLGVRGVLVASALHDGRITPADCWQ
jgi:phosphoribosylformimino-5-aminoimidazole carboxamide ribotide isomerase